MKKKQWLDKLYYEIGKQQFNFELCCLTKEGSKSKWKKYLDVQSDEKFLEKANNRSIFPNEVAIDLEDPKLFVPVFEKIKRDFKFYSAYKTGSRGYHINLFFDKELDPKQKLIIIKKYAGDTQKASKRCMLALENCPHWKTGNPKELIEENFGYNALDEVDFSEYSYSFYNSKEISIERVLKVIENNFSGMSFPTECCLSFIHAILLKDLSNPLGLNLEGAPSSEKTTILCLFYGIKGITFKSDSFTPKSFVSHSANIREEQLSQIDLLPKIKYKVFLVPELAPIFGKRKEDLIENLSVLTRVFDGEGLETDSGARGHRGYVGDYPFIWIGATTPLPTHVWNVMGKLGQRFLFLKIPEKNKTNEDLRNVMTDISYKKKINNCRKVIQEFIKYNFTKTGSPGSIEWDRERDSKELLDLIVSLSKFIAGLRAPIEIYSSDYDGKFQFKTPIKEEPERAISHLYDVARGHALLFNRDYVTMQDARIVFEVALCSCPFERYKLLELFFDAEKSEFNSKEIAYLLNCSERNARKVMKTLEILGVGENISFNSENRGVGRPETIFKLFDEYFDLLEKFKKIKHMHTVDFNSEINKGTQTDSVGAEKNSKYRVLKTTPENLVDINGDILPSFKQGSIINLEEQYANPMIESGYLIRI